MYKKKWGILAAIFWGILAVLPTLTQAQEAQLRGTVIDDSGNPLSGVTITTFHDSTALNHLQSDSAGRFTVQHLVVGEKYNFLFSFSGFEPYKENAILIGSSVNNLLVRMKASSKNLEEVVVGYGTQKKINLTGAVSQISGDVFQAHPITNVAQGLQGQIPNLNITFSDGKPGRQASFNVRGMPSINGGSPLILIDGVPGDINILNPSDIESVSVLKDAASAAIYGARGAFGVILITTKNGKQSASPVVSYTGSYAFSKPTRIPELYMDDPVKYAKIQDSAAGGPGYQVSTYTMDYLLQRQADPSLPAIKAGQDANGNAIWIEGGNTNWYDMLYSKKAPMYQHQLSVSGGSNKVTYYVSGGYINQDGILKIGTDNLSKYNLRTKVNANLNDWMKIYDYSEYSKSIYDQPNTYMQYNLNAFRMLSQNANVYNVAKTPDGYWTTEGAPLGFLQDGGRKIDNNWLFRNIIGSDFFFLKKRLTMHVNFTYQTDGNFGTERRYAFNYSPSPGVVKQFPIDDPNSFKRITSNNAQRTWNVYGDYSWNMGKHGFKVLAGYNQEDRKDNYYYVLRNGIVSDEYSSLNLGTGTIKTDESDGGYALRGGFARVNYNFSGKYLVELNSRYDLTSRFPKEHRGGFFPSVSAGWVISNEDFFDKLGKAINLFKIRGSYGSLGNQLVSDFGYLPTMGVYMSSSVFNGQQLPTTSAPAHISSNITWETARTMNIGTDLAFVDNKLTISYDYYIRKTLNMLVTSGTLPSIYGATPPTENAADLKTNGWEATVKWSSSIGKGANPLNYFLSLVLSDNSSKITRYPGNSTKYLGTWSNPQYYQGQNVGEIWGYQTDGFFTGKETANIDYKAIYSSFTPTAGDLKFKDVNNDGKVDKGKNTYDDHGDLKVIGNATPRYSFGFTVGGNWKGLDFSVFLQGVAKRDFMPNNEAAGFWGFYNRKYQPVWDHIVGNYWTESHTDAYFPKLRSYVAGSWQDQELSVNQTRYLQNAAYLRFKNLTIGYSIPQYLLKKAHLSQLRFYFSGQNIFEWTKLSKAFDPEGLVSDPDAPSYSGQGLSYSYLRSYSFGLQLTF